MIQYVKYPSYPIRVKEWIDLKNKNFTKDNLHKQDSKWKRYRKYNKIIRMDKVKRKVTLLG